jgi:hypothetical protein
MLTALLLTLGTTLPVSAWQPTDFTRIKLCDLRLSGADETTFAMKPAEMVRAKGWRARAHDLRLLARARFGRPTYRGDRYDITLVGAFNRYQGSPAVVLRRLRKVLDGFYDELDRAKLKTKHRNTFIVALNGHEIRPSLFAPADTHGPSTSPAYYGYRVRKFWNRWRLLGDASNDQHIVIPFDDNGGPLLNRFTLAHELAHDVFRVSEQVLDEAMVDALAMALTDQHRVQSVDLLGRDAQTSGERPAALWSHRDLAHPAMTHLDQLVPELTAYHNNSVLFGGLFYEISQRHGHAEMVDLLKHLAARPDQLPIITDRDAVDQAPGFEPKFIKHSDTSAQWSADMIFAFNMFLPVVPPRGRRIAVDRSSKPEYKRALVEAALIIGEVIHEWASARGLHIDDLLVQRGLRPQ